MHRPGQRQQTLCSALKAERTRMATQAVS